MENIVSASDLRGIMKYRAKDKYIIVSNEMGTYYKIKKGKRLLYKKRRCDKGIIK